MRGTDKSSGGYYWTEGITGCVGKHFFVVLERLLLKVTSTKNLERKKYTLFANADNHSSPIWAKSQNISGGSYWTES